MVTISSTIPIPTLLISSSLPIKGLTKLAPALAAISACKGENTSVTLMLIFSFDSILVALIPSVIMGIFTTILSANFAKCRASLTMPSA